MSTTSKVPIVVGKFISDNLRPVQVEGSRPPLFWLHNGPTDGFINGYLGSDQPLYVFKHQGSGGERIELKQVEAIATNHLEQIFTVQMQGPYFLAGYSFGGTLAFEMARQLKTIGQSIGLLFIVDALSPGTPTDDNAPSRRRRAAIIKACLATGWRVPFRLRLDYILSVYLPAISEYSPAPFEGRMVYIQSEERPDEHAAKWESLCLGGADVHEVPGCNHVTIMEAPHRHAWARKLKQALDTFGHYVVVGDRHSAPSIVREVSAPGWCSPSAHRPFLRSDD